MFTYTFYEYKLIRNFIHTVCTSFSNPAFTFLEKHQNKNENMHNFLQIPLCTPFTYRIIETDHTKCFNDQIWYQDGVRFFFNTEKCITSCVSAKKYLVITSCFILLMVCKLINTMTVESKDMSVLNLSLRKCQ